MDGKSLPPHTRKSSSKTGWPRARRSSASPRSCSPPGPSALGGPAPLLPWEASATPGQSWGRRRIRVTSLFVRCSRYSPGYRKHSRSRVHGLQLSLPRSDSVFSQTRHCCRERGRAAPAPKESPRLSFQQQETPPAESCHLVPSGAAQWQPSPLMAGRRHHADGPSLQPQRCSRSPAGRPTPSPLSSLSSTGSTPLISPFFPKLSPPCLCDAVQFQLFPLHSWFSASRLPSLPLDLFYSGEYYKDEKDAVPAQEGHQLEGRQTWRQLIAEAGGSGPKNEAQRAVDAQRRERRP